MKKYFEILSIDEEKIPKIKEVRKKYVKLCIEKHPDKNMVVDYDFSDLKEAYEMMWIHNRKCERR